MKKERIMWVLALCSVVLLGLRYDNDNLIYRFTPCDDDDAATCAGVDSFKQILVNPGALAVSTDSIAAVPTAYSSGGATPYHLVSAGTTNATVVKASAGQVYAVQVANINASPRYIKFYNKATAPTCNSDTVVKTLLLPGATTGGGQNYNSSVGTIFTTGIAFCITAGITDTDNTAVAASEILVNIDYK